MFLETQSITATCRLLRTLTKQYLLSGENESQ